MSIAAKLKKSGVDLRPKKPEPLWKGPEVGGVTQSMIGRWLTCRERFRIKNVIGLNPVDRFSHQIEYGQMWHLCEEMISSDNPWEEPLKEYCQELCTKYPTDQEQIEKWYQVCKIQFPIYVEYWADHPETIQGKSVFEEQVFKVPYALPSGRTVILRGKWDGATILTENGKRGLYLREHKTKGDIDTEQLQRNLTFDLQTMMYLVAMERFDWTKKFDVMSEKSPISVFKGAPLKGVLYNVVRRPLSGGKGSIVQKKGSKNIPPETKSEYYERLREIIANASGEEWGTPDGENWFFARWRVEVGGLDLKRFRDECLDPILEQMACWYGCVTGKPELVPTWAQNFRHPFNVTNNIDEYGSSDLDNYLATGSTVGLVKTELFKELQ